MDSKSVMDVGQAGTSDERLVIDCSTLPHSAEGWVVRPEDQIASAFRGQLVWTPDCIRLHLVDGQQDGWFSGFDLKEALAGQPVLPANVLYWQLADPENRIPASWSGSYVIYWGTIFYGDEGCLYVLNLYPHEGRWFYHYECLESDLNQISPAAVLAI
ncbi:MAG: hypothetical protein V1738_00625 [Patescibacteria group bacterium]